MSTPLLECRQLQVTVPGRTLVQGLNCVISGGEFVALLGGNGAGKTLLLRTLAGLRAPDAGQVLLAGKDLQILERRDIARQLGFMPQDPEAPPQGSVLESVLLGRFAHLGFWERSGDSDRELVARALEHVGLGALRAREVGSLSGGEQRRAAIARLRVQAPAVYLLDEPTNHLDPAQQIGVLRGFRELTHDGAAVVASLHDPNLALRFADRIGLLSGNGSVELVESAHLVTGDLARLYGLAYAEGRVGSQRFMAPE